MKKTVLSLIVLLIICLLLSACGAKDLSYSNVNFHSYQAACTAKSADLSHDTAYKVITSQEELADYITQTNANFVTDSQYEAVNSFYNSDSFDNIVSGFSGAFFDNYNLIAITRYHSTEKPLSFSQVDIQNNSVNISASLETGGNQADVFRIYFIRLDKTYCSEKSEINLDISSVEANGDAFESTAMISKAYNYKVITDLNYAQELENLISSYSLTPSEESASTLDSLTDNDCVFVYNGYTAAVTQSVIIINKTAYLPNEELRNALISAYNTLDAEIVTEEIPDDDGCTVITTAQS